MPGNIKQAQLLTPVYEEIGGWSEEIDQVRSLDELPRAAREYLTRVEELTDTPPYIVSVGPGREQTLLLKNPFE
jgi:adenylosuccinate synthase